MKNFAILAVGALMLGLPAVAPFALTQSAAAAATGQAEVNYYIANMTCGLCPVTVKKAMSAVKGVQQVDVDATAQTVHVVYDASLTDPAAIAKASEDAGYPATIKG